MYLPLELQRLVKEYSMPITRADWRQGCSISRLLDENKQHILYDFKYFIHFQHYLMNR